MKGKYALMALIIITIILGAYLAFLYYIDFKIVDYKELNTSVIIVPRGGGFNLDKNSLNFGKNYPGGAGVRFFNVSSNHDAIVKIKVSGNIADFISFSDNDFMLLVNNTIQINATLRIPENTSLGNYSGIIKIYFVSS